MTCKLLLYTTCSLVNIILTKLLTELFSCDFFYYSLDIIIRESLTTGL